MVKLNRNTVILFVASWLFFALVLLFVLEKGGTGNAVKPQALQIEKDPLSNYHKKYEAYSTSNHNHDHPQDTLPRDTEGRSLKFEKSELDPSLVSQANHDYEVTDQPDCFFHGCVDEGNFLAKAGCNSQGNVWMEKGAKEMVRFLNLGETELFVYNNRTIRSALEYFENAVKEDPTCARAHENIGLILMKLADPRSAIIHFELSSTPRSHIFMGLAYELLDNKAKATEHYSQGIRQRPDFDKEYHGIALGTTSGVIREHSPTRERKAVLDQLLWKEFGDITFGNFGIMPPDWKNTFLRERWMVIPRFIPHYVLKATAECYHGMIKDGTLKLGDAQSQRYVAYNSRCMSFIHRAMTDFVRKMVSHNAKPSYTYFGGYVEGAELVPHTDRQQCEFTISWTLQNYPEGEPWPLGLDEVPEWHGRKDEYGGNNGLKWPPKNRQKWANLYASDALLFMGRRHNHFREGALTAGHWINQVFMHYVPDRFEGKLG